MPIQRASVQAQALTACVTTLLIVLAAAGGVLEAHNPLEVFRAERLQIVLGNEEEATLSANSTTLERSGHWVSVTLDGVKDPQDTDIVALFAPPDNIKPGQSPVKYKFAVFDAEYLATGRAELT
ncbi:hypothetical protein H632_c4154p0 [Helicosporidium sp. ATCC 50920]|nr:hypothetical protein H632_c4154p0 [Helicosporidium sp. ATCC 50920]|eukprot:KDD71927.1 hypothetical protein H632_c4154p0 [Helicosporidium sp. ATCC 50920]